MDNFTGSPWSFLLKRIRLVFPITLLGDKVRTYPATVLVVRRQDARRHLLQGAGQPGRGVDLSMLNEVAVVNEILAALLTLVRPLPGVNSLMLNKDRASAKALAALAALEGLLSRVDPEVMEEPSVLAEGFPADAALVALLPGVEPLVLEQARALAEGAPTLLALVRLLPRVRPLVLDKDGILGEALPTFTTDIGSLHGRAWPLPLQPAVPLTGVSALRHLNSITIPFLCGFQKRPRLCRKLPRWAYLHVPSPGLPT